MRTQVGKSIASVHKEFFEDAKHLGALEPDLLERLPEVASRLRFTRLRRESTAVLDELREGAGKVGPVELNAALSAATYLLTHMEASDTADAVIADMQELGLATPENRQGYERLVSATLRLKQGDFARRDRVRRAAINVLDTLTALRWEVDLRAVLESPAEYEQDPSAYQPKVLGFTPVVVVELKVGEDSRVVFQLDERDLAMVRDQILAMEKDFKEAVSSHRGKGILK